jgi:hypothetical protein
MEPTRDITLSDVLNRLLDKGLVINADIIITVAGIPLVGVALRAAVAGIETMLDYGMMEDLDRRIREGQVK